MKPVQILRITMLTSVVALLSFVPANRKRFAIKKTTGISNPVKKNNPYYIIVDKSEYELYVYDEEGWYATYPIVFGSKDLSDKMKEGDKRTPDGSFRVILKKIHWIFSSRALMHDGFRDGMPQLKNNESNLST